MSGGPVGFQIHAGDNVGTLLNDVETGEVITHRGEGQNQVVRAQQQVKAGHKVALCSIAKGDPIVKYGMTIGTATSPIAAGDWVHLHNCESRYDSRSSHLDVNSGAPTETRYE